MKTKLKLHVLLLALLILPALVRAQGTAFSYQGHIVANGAAANGAHDFLFALFDSAAGGIQIGPDSTLNNTPVANGQFNVSLDFGAGAFPGAARWLEISVRPAGAGAYTKMDARVALLPTPYAIQARTAGSVANGTVTANQLNTGGLAPAPGQFLSYNGGNLVWSDPGVAVGNIWSRSGANAYYTAGNVGIGTSTPVHRLSLAGGPDWTGNHWGGALELANGSAIGWRSNVGGQRFGIGQSSGGLYFFRTASDPGTTGSPAVYDMEITDTGHVLVGAPSTDFAGIPLQVNGAMLVKTPGSGGNIQFATPGAETGMTIIGANRADVRFDGTTLKLVAITGNGVPPAANGIAITTSGNVGIGSATPVAKLEVVGQDALRLVGYEPFLSLIDSGAGYASSRIQSLIGEMVFFPSSYLNGSDPNAYAKLFNSGNFSVKTLTIRGGADLAEPFEFSARDIVKGSVLIIDEEQPGKLKLSTHAYDTRVAGIVSGANGVNPGISLHQDGVLENGQNVALSGRVYVLADATNNAIKPGDLLTTSDTPGHAMKVAHPNQSQGAVLGKAMSGLKDGKGMVLVLVTLQ